MHPDSGTKQISLSVLRLVQFCTTSERKAEKWQQGDDGAVVILI
jgi:hypothetical protein